MKTLKDEIKKTLMTNENKFFPSGYISKEVSKNLGRPVRTASTNSVLTRLVLIGYVKRLLITGNPRRLKYYYQIVNKGSWDNYTLAYFKRLCYVNNIYIDPAEIEQFKQTPIYQKYNSLLPFYEKKYNEFYKNAETIPLNTDNLVIDSYNNVKEFLAA